MARRDVGTPSCCLPDVPANEVCPAGPIQGWAGPHEASRGGQEHGMDEPVQAKMMILAAIKDTPHNLDLS
jgi:hypothetical protein